MGLLFNLLKTSIFLTGLFLTDSFIHIFEQKRKTFEKRSFSGDLGVVGTSGKTKSYSLGNWEMAKNTRTSRNGVLRVPRGIPNHNTHLVLIQMDKKLFSLGVIFLLLRIFFEHFLQTIRNASLVKFVTPFLIHKKFILQLDISFLSFQ